MHHPHIEIPSDQIAQLEKRLPKLITIADNNCMISNAVRNNVDIKNLSHHSGQIKSLRDNVYSTI